MSEIAWKQVVCVCVCVCVCRERSRQLRDTVLNVCSADEAVYLVFHCLVYRDAPLNYCTTTFECCMVHKYCNLGRSVVKIFPWLAQTTETYSKIFLTMNK